MEKRLRNQLFIVIIAIVITILPFTINYSVITKKEHNVPDQLYTDELYTTEAYITESDLMLMNENPSDIDDQVDDFSDVDSEPDRHFDQKQNDSPEIIHDVQLDESLSSSTTNKNSIQQSDNTSNKTTKLPVEPQPTPAVTMITEPLQQSHLEQIQILQPLPSVIPVTNISISLNRSNSLYKTGDTGILSVTVFPQNATDKNYQITVSDNILSIMQTGHFTAEEAGSTVISVTASNGVNRDITVTVLDINVLAAEVMKLTNAERIRNNLSVLSDANTILNSTAATRVKEIIVCFTHTRPDGRGQGTAYEDLGGQYTGHYSSTGENIAAGHNTSTSVLTAFMNSPVHRTNILNPKYTCLGIAVDIDNNGRMYWVQMFFG